MATPKRIYVVKNRETGEVEALVDTTSRSRAVFHVAGGQYEAEPANARTVAALLGSGIKLEVPGEEPSDDGQ